MKKLRSILSQKWKHYLRICRPNAIGAFFTHKFKDQIAQFSIENKAYVQKVFLI